MSANSCTKGQEVEVLHSDNKWYRGIITKVCFDHEVEIQYYVEYASDGSAKGEYTKTFRYSQINTDFILKSNTFNLDNDTKENDDPQFHDKDKQINQLKVRLKATEQKLKQEINSHITTIRSQGTELEKAHQAMEKLGESFNRINKDLDNCRGNGDKLRHDLKESLKRNESFINKINSQEQIIQNLQIANNKLNHKVEVQKGVISGLQDTLSQKRTEVKQHKDQLNNNNSKMQDKFKKMQKKMQNQSQECKEAQKALKQQRAKTSSLRNKIKNNHITIQRLQQECAQFKEIKQQNENIVAENDNIKKEIQKLQQKCHQFEEIKQQNEDIVEENDNIKKQIQEWNDRGLVLGRDYNQFTFQELSNEESILQKELESISSAKQEINDKQERKINCNSCMDHNKNMLFIPCGHVVFCEECVASYDKTICPYCHEEYEDVKRVIIA